MSKQIDIAEALEDVADQLPDRHFSSTGEAMPAPTDTPPPKTPAE